MKYDHEVWDLIMKLFEYAERQLEEHGTGIMLAEVLKMHEQAVSEFSLHRDQLAWFLNYFCGENCLNSPPGLDRLNDVETFATQSDDLKASSTKEGKKAVEEAQKRLDEQERLRPATEARSNLDEAEKLTKEKELAAQRDKEERDRPKRELEEARKAEQAAEAAVTAAEEAVQKVKP